MRNPKHYIIISVPLSHRLESISKKIVNKYHLANLIANRHHRNCISGGGCTLGEGSYKITVYMPVHKVKAFREDLGANHIRSKDLGILKNFEDNYEIASNI